MALRKPVMKKETALRLVRLDLTNTACWNEFCGLFEQYLTEVCPQDELAGEIADLHDERLKAQLIEQTLRTENPYFVMKLVQGDLCTGLISCSYDAKTGQGFVNNLFVLPAHRKKGLGAAACRLIEGHVRRLGGRSVALCPVERAREFYLRQGYAETGRTIEGESLFRKSLT